MDRLLPRVDDSLRSPRVGSTPRRLIIGSHSTESGSALLEAVVALSVLVVIAVPVCRLLGSVAVEAGSARAQVVGLDLVRSYLARAAADPIPITATGAPLVGRTLALAPSPVARSGVDYQMSERLLWPSGSVSSNATTSSYLVEVVTAKWDDSKSVSMSTLVALDLRRASSGVVLSAKRSPRRSAHLDSQLERYKSNHFERHVT